MPFTTGPPSRITRRSASSATINIGPCCTCRSPWDTISSACAGTPTAAITTSYLKNCSIAEVASNWRISDQAGHAIEVRIFAGYFFHAMIVHERDNQRVSRQQFELPAQTRRSQNHLLGDRKNPDSHLPDIG